MKKPQRGFSLLELLIVVALIAAIAAFTVPNFFGRNEGKELENAQIQIADLFQNASDYSLFRGQLLAVELQSSGMIPLIFDYQTGEFIELADDALLAIELPDSLSLDWELDQSDSQLKSLSETVDGAIEKLNERDSDAPEELSDKKPEYKPQLFFFPSGEATPVTLILRNNDYDADWKLSVDILGRLDNADKTSDQGDYDG